MEVLTAISQNFVAFIIVISILVFVHEFGHYYVAIRNKVRVEEFSIGFGPEMFGWNDKRGTRWKVCWLPLGGYVRMYGDQDPASAPPDQKTAAAMTAADREVAFFAKPVGVRAAIVAAGPGINFLFSILVLFLLYISLGQIHIPPRVGDLQPDMPAIQVGMQVGDTVTSVNGQAIDDFSDIRRAMALNLGERVTLEVDRAGEKLQFVIDPKVTEVENPTGSTNKMGRLGIGAPPERTTIRLDPLTAAKAAVADTWHIVHGTLISLWQIITGNRSSSEIGGVITIAKVSGDMSVSLASFIWFMAVLSANLGLINLFPIPVLDGGHLVFYAAEAVRRKPLSERAQEYSLRFGLALVVSLMVFALWNDLNTFGVVEFLQKLI